jgi:hypothetical protein
MVEKQRKGGALPYHASHNLEKAHYSNALICENG